jgi:hypothetical protein
MAREPTEPAPRGRAAPAQDAQGVRITMPTLELPLAIVGASE